ncbi:MAG: hypothetical protein R2991_10815 [Thermoanaerobaculia bacterium]
MVGGREVPISAGLAEAGRSETGADAATTGGAAAAGAILGRSTASRHDRKKGRRSSAPRWAPPPAPSSPPRPRRGDHFLPSTFVTLTLDQPVHLTVERQLLARHPRSPAARLKRPAPLLADRR